MSPLSSRALHHLALPVALVVIVVASSLAAVAVRSDLVDTVLGFVAGAAAVLLPFVVLVQVLGVRASGRARDEAALDGLEPLRAARRRTRG